MAIAREAVVQIQDFTEQNLSNTCWAFVPCQKKGQGEAMGHGRCLRDWIGEKSAGLMMIDDD